MKTLILYDSDYGNTAKIARAIGRGLESDGKVIVIPVHKFDNAMLKNIDMLVVGSPTQGGRPTTRIQEFLNNLPDLFGLKVAAFDTRFAERGHGIALGLLMKTIGYAAGKISNDLTGKGGVEVLAPEGFIVTGKQGPLKTGEIERAGKWVQSAQQLT